MEELAYRLKWSYTAEVDPLPINQPVTMPEQPPVPPPYVPDWSTAKGAYHATRVMCDEMGLTFNQKEIVCGCIFQESRFLNYVKPGVPTTNKNRDASGNVWSTDWGIGQVNDYYHCGPGKTFPSVQYVLDNPDKVVAWMIGFMKKTGKLQPWASYTSGAYRQWLSPSSPMRALKS